MINKSAAKIGTIEWENGNRVDLHAGTNHNTGEQILWQQVHGRRASRITGQNIALLLAELDEVLNEGRAKWVGEVNYKVLEGVAR